MTQAWNIRNPIGGAGEPYATGPAGIVIRPGVTNSPEFFEAVIATLNREFPQHSADASVEPAPGEFVLGSPAIPVTHSAQIGDAVVVISAATAEEVLEVLNGSQRPASYGAPVAITNITTSAENLIDFAALGPICGLASDGVDGRPQVYITLPNVLDAKGGATTIDFTGHLTNLSTGDHWSVRTIFKGKSRSPYSRRVFMTAGCDNENEMLSERIKQLEAANLDQDRRMQELAAERDDFKGRVDQRTRDVDYYQDIMERCCQYLDIKYDESEALNRRYETLFDKIKQGIDVGPGLQVHGTAGAVSAVYELLARYAKVQRREGYLTARTANSLLIGRDHQVYGSAEALKATSALMRWPRVDRMFRAAVSTPFWNNSIRLDFENEEQRQLALQEWRNAVAAHYLRGKS